jgi:HD-GYP domain-containing protein (c-di-GMP phosphodiesterase class II)
MAYFHDIGKIVLEDELLLDEVVFSKEQLLRMRQHPAIAYRILNLFDETLDIAPCIYAHHENWDGTGYPKGLKGEEIPYMARIISVAEVYDALTNKIDNKNYTKNNALDEIAALSGTKIDPDLARVFIGLMREKEFVKEGV